MLTALLQPRVTLIQILLIMSADELPETRQKLKYFVDNILYKKQEPLRFNKKDLVDYSDRLRIVEDDLESRKGFFYEILTGIIYKERLQTDALLAAGFMTAFFFQRAEGIDENLLD